MNLKLFLSEIFCVFLRQKLMDGATPIVVIDTNDILHSLQKATIKNKERESANRQQNAQPQPLNGSNGTNDKDDA